jgi:hypothetical protein
MPWLEKIQIYDCQLTIYDFRSFFGILLPKSKSLILDQKRECRFTIVD